MDWKIILTVVGPVVVAIVAAVLTPVRMIFTGQLVTRREHENMRADLQKANEVNDRRADVQAEQLREILTAVRGLGSVGRKAS
jgi:hypothetical protein